MNEELNMETMEETEINDVDSVDEIEVSEGLNIAPLAFVGVGLGLLGAGFGFRKQIKAKLEEAAVNRMIKRGYEVHKIKMEEESEESDEVESEDLD